MGTKMLFISLLIMALACPGGAVVDADRGQLLFTEYSHALHISAPADTVGDRSNSANFPTAADKESGPAWKSYATIAGAHAAGAYPTYRGLTGLWGSPTGKFHFKNEVDDYLLFNDEVSHLFISYKLYQGCKSVYGGIGFSHRGSKILGVMESAFIMTAVEIPMDAFNPTQGFGATDLLADYAGIALGWWKSAEPRLEDVDLKVSVKSASSNSKSGLAHDNEDYDNYIYWVTYRYKFALAGVGYSTTRVDPVNPSPQMFLGIGTTVPDLVGLFSKSAADYLRPLELYFLNVRLEPF
jgi:hypothetical protein